MNKGNKQPMRQHLIHCRRKSALACRRLAQALPSCEVFEKACETGVRLAPEASTVRFAC